MLHTLLAAGLAAAAPAASAPEQPAPAQSAPSDAVIAPASPPILVPPAPPAPVACCVLAKLTPVFRSIDEPLDSDKSKIGQRFKLSLAHPLEMAGGLTIPAGTPGAG